MLAHYVRHFETVELNFSYYRMPDARTLDAIAAKTPDGFTFWVKANQETTHMLNRDVAPVFLEALEPMTAAGKLAGVLMQFPQSFHRTVDARKYLSATLEDFASVPLAVEFRHRSWDCPEVLAGLRERNVTVVIPDVPAIEALYGPAPAVTTRTGYLRLHSRDASKWYAGAQARYDYNYTEADIREFLDGWSPLAGRTDRVYTFFNNCHRGQAAENALAMRRILQQI